jgi:hypothetical protein
MATRGPCFGVSPHSHTQQSHDQAHSFGQDRSYNLTLTHYNKSRTNKLICMTRPGYKGVICHDGNSEFGLQKPTVTKTDASCSNRKGRGHRSIIMCAVLTMTALFVGGNTAKADVPAGFIDDVYMNVAAPGEPGAGNNAGYEFYSLIVSLRVTAGHPFRQGTSYLPETMQYPQLNYYVTGLIRMTLTRLPRPNTNETGADLVLWFTPNDLYLRGFTTTSGRTYQFNDAQNVGGYTLAQHLQMVGYNSPQGVATLNYGSNYNSLTQASQVGRQNLGLSYDSFWDALNNLAYTNDNRTFGFDRAHVATSIMRMIQFTSEAARFNDVFGVAHDVMSHSWSNYSGLPLFQQYLENNWGRISAYGFQVSQNPLTTPVTIYGINPNVPDPNNTYSGGQPYTLSSFQDVLRFLAVLAGNPGDPANGGVNQDWNVSEE